MEFQSEQGFVIGIKNFLLSKTTNAAVLWRKKQKHNIMNEIYVQNAKTYSVPHEESRKMFFVHFASFLQNQMSYGHVLCTTMILYLP